MTTDDRTTTGAAAAGPGGAVAAAAAGDQHAIMVEHLLRRVLEMEARLGQTRSLLLVLAVIVGAALFIAVLPS